MDKDTLITNTFTMGATGLAVMNNPVTTLTVISLCVAILANLVVIYKNIVSHFICDKYYFLLESLMFL